MNTNFAHIPLEELKEDWLTSHQCILDFEAAIKAGITHILEGQVTLQNRIEKNKDIIRVIEKEMKDRGLTIDWVAPTKSQLWVVDPVRLFRLECNDE